MSSIRRSAKLGNATLLVVLAVISSASLFVFLVPGAYAYKASLEVPLSNGHKVTVLFADDFPDFALERNMDLLRKNVPRIAELFYMPDYDFNITYYTDPLGFYGDYRAIRIHIVPGTYYREESPTEGTLIHELTHVFQFELGGGYVREETATAVTAILMGTPGFWAIDDMMVAENGPALFANAKFGSGFGSYYLGNGWMRLYAHKPTIFREYTSQEANLGNRDIFHALLGETVFDSRPLAKWVYDQGLGRVGPTERGLYIQNFAYSRKAGTDYTQTLIDTMVSQWTDDLTPPTVVQPQSIICRFHRLTGEFLSETLAENGHCEYLDYRNDDAIRVDIRIETRSGILERRLLSFKYEETIDGNIRWHSYVALVGDDGLPVLVNGTASVNVHALNGSAWSFQSPVVNGVVKLNSEVAFGVANIDFSTPSLQYHYENFPFIPGARGVSVNPFTPYVGLYSEKWLIESNENARLVVTSYPFVNNGSLTVEYKRLNEATWRALASGVQPQNGRSEFEWGPTGDSERTNYVFKATWSDGTRTATSNPTVMVRQAAKPCEYSLSVDPSSVTIRQGEQASLSVTVGLVSGLCGIVNFAVSDWGGGTGLSSVFNPIEGTPSFASTLIVLASSTASTGTFAVTVQGTGAATRSAIVYVTVEHPQTVQPTSLSISFSPETVDIATDPPGRVIINVVLSPMDMEIYGKPILVYQSKESASGPWILIRSCNATLSGQCAFSWQPGETGVYFFKGEFEGDLAHLPSSITSEPYSLAVVPEFCSGSLWMIVIVVVVVIVTRCSRRKMKPNAR